MNRITKLAGSGGEKHKRLYVDFEEQWSSLFGRMNWYDFTFIHLTVEHSPYKASSEIEIGLLGLFLRVTWIYDHQFLDELEERMKKEAGV